MKWLNAYRIRLVLVGAVATFVLGRGSVKADFTFGEPKNLGPTINSVTVDLSPSLTADGLELYFMSMRGTGGIWFTRRATTSDPWEEPRSINLPGISTGQYFDPDISADGLSLYLNSSTRPDERYGFIDIYVSSRTTKSDAWSEPVNIGPPINTSFSESSSWVSTDGLTLYFSGNPTLNQSPQQERPGGYGMADIWFTTKQTTERNPEGYWSEPQNLGPVVNSTSLDAQPFVTDDERILLFTSDRPGGYGSTDLWMTRRDSRDYQWGTPVNLGLVVNSAFEDAGPEISSDGSVLFFFSMRSGGQGLLDIWQAPIIPIVDLNSDGIVDSGDMVIMVDNWGTDNKLCDIGPMPWGDGIVDVQDLIVLAEHLFEEVPPVQ